jgi:hypothetical protein
VAADLYISADIEADGPIPGAYSMLAFGLAVAGRFDGRSFEARDPSATTLYRELRPISENIDPDALRLASLDRRRLEGFTKRPAYGGSLLSTWAPSKVA